MFYIAIAVGAILLLIPVLKFVLQLIVGIIQQISISAGKSARRAAVSMVFPLPLNGAAIRMRGALAAGPVSAPQLFLPRSLTGDAGIVSRTNIPSFIRCFSRFRFL